jgi:hypothetical protein
MLSPLLIIGVGGAGGKTIRAMKQELNRILESSGYTGGIPAAWQFLQIDTTVDGEGFPAPMLSSDEMHRVVPNGASYADVLAFLKHGSSLHEQQKMFAGWVFPDPLISINQSPSQVRAIGRVTVMADAGKTLQALQASISKMNAPSAMSELANIARVLESGSPNSQPQSFIVSSLSGGSGSGMFMDVAELLKRATNQNWAQQSISFLYTPDVFRSIGRTGNDVSKNALGAINELIASQLVGLSEQSEFLYSKMGLVEGGNLGRESFGCRTNILIDARNSVGADTRLGANDEGMYEVFLNIGKSLAQVVSNDETYEFFVNAFTHDSWSHGAVDISGLAPESLRGLTGASSIGFGKMTLGADQLVDYVADALTKCQVEKLLWPDFTPDLMKIGIHRSTLIQDKTDEIWLKFLKDVGLNERGEQSRIIDAILPGRIKEQIREFVTGMLRSHVSAKPIQIGDLSTLIWSEWEAASQGYLKTIQNDVNSQSQGWVLEIQKKMREYVAIELSQNGYSVVSNLIDRLEIELKEYALPELLVNALDFDKAVGSFDQRALAGQINEIAEGQTEVSSQDVSFLEKLSASISSVVECQLNSCMNNLAASLVQDMLSVFLAPLKEQLVKSRFDLQMSQKGDHLRDGSRNLYLNFPDWGSGKVPNQYKGGPLERILIDSADYESTYEFYANKDSQGGPAFQQSVISALLGKKMNPMPDDLNCQTLINVSNSWEASVRETQSNMGAAESKSVWSFHTDIQDLSKKNRTWLRDSKTSFGAFTRMSIREYVGAVDVDPKTRATREAKFVKEFDALLNIGKPLILLNANAIQHVLSVGDGGNATGILSRCSRVPFSADSVIGQGCTSVLEKNGFDRFNPSFVQHWFDAASDDSALFSISTIGNKLPTWAFASLTEPILEQVALSKTMAQTWIQFWNGRRTRPLTESIPFETEMRRSIVTGWFVASLFGMRRVTTFPIGRTVQIWNPTLETPDWSSFPSPLLPTRGGDSQRESWVLPQLLMSAGIALAEFGKSGNPEHINGYRLLKFLGREVTTSFNYRDHWDGRGTGDMLPSGKPAQSNYLKNWVESGESPNENGELSKTLQISLALSPDRGEALIKTVQLMSAEYKSIWDTFSETPWHSLPETWELKEDIALALSDIALYVSELQNSTSLNRD